MAQKYETEIDSLFMLQVEHQEEIGKLSVKQRKALLRQLLHEVEQRQTIIEEALIKDLYKPALETGYTEVLPLILEIKHFIKNLNRWAKPKRVKNNLIFFGNKPYIISEPKGKCLIISPWNYPFLLPLMHLTAAVAAGNTVIVKPSEFAPHTAILIKEIVGKVFPPHHVSVVEGAVEETTYLLTKKFDHIHFTGSPQVGKTIMEAAAKHLSGLTLELGGKSPAIVDGDADIKQTVNTLIWGKMVNLGQTCIAPDYLLLHKSIEKEFIKTFMERMQKVFGVDSSQSPHLARMVNQRHFDRVKNLIEDARTKGAEVLMGGNYVEEERFIAPTLLCNIPADALILQEEIFGPVFPIIIFKDYSEAKQIINGGEKPLSMYVFSKKTNALKYFEQHTSSGAIVTNEVLVHMMHPNLPFGGINHSGMGQSSGIYGFREFSHQKPVLRMRLPITPSKLMGFPYTKTTKKIVNLLIKRF